MKTKNLLPAIFILAMSININALHLQAQTTQTFKSGTVVKNDKAVWVGISDLYPEATGLFPNDNGSHVRSSGCTYGDDPANATIVTLDASGKYLSANNENGGCTTTCYAPECLPNSGFWGRSELCNRIQCGSDCCNAGTCCVIDTISNSECWGGITQMAAIVSCDIVELGEWNGVGTLENSSFAKFTPSASDNYTFKIFNISCGGAGSGGASVLQWNIFTGYVLGDPTTGTSLWGGTDSTDQSKVLPLTVGVEYWISFDGNFGSDCTWGFSIERGGVLGIMEKEKPLEYRVMVAPNPFSSSSVLYISLSREFRGGYLNFVMYNLLGSEVRNVLIDPKQENEIKTIISRRDLPNGIYVYQLKNEDNQTLATGKIVIQ